jgi:SAM-dependent methyltransferase
MVPVAKLPNGVLQSCTEWQQATKQGISLKLPLHRAAEKNWDHLAAVYAIANTVPKCGYVLDAGAEFYSNVLPALYVCGFRNLFGINLAFTDPARRGPIHYLPGDITRTVFADGTFDAITCLSVIEHGVSLLDFFKEMYRLLKPGGIMIISTDYFPDPIDTKMQAAYGTPIRIFSREQATEMITMAVESGFQTTGEINLSCSQRPIRWDAYDLEFSFLIFTLRRPLKAGSPDLDDQFQPAALSDRI